MRERVPNAVKAGEGLLLLQWRERRRDDEHVLLLDEHAAGRRRPGAAGASLVANAEAFGRVFVSPDVDPLVERAELGMTGRGQWRELDTPFDPLGPELDSLPGDAGLHRVRADLVE